MELSRFESQLCPFSSRVDEASAMPARSIHSASDLLFAWLLSPGVRRACDELGRFLVVPGWWWRGRISARLCRFVSLNPAALVELLLRPCRLRDVLREWERMGGVLGTETLEM